MLFATLPAAGDSAVAPLVEPSPGPDLPPKLARRIGPTWDGCLHLGSEAKRGSSARKQPLGEEVEHLLQGQPGGVVRVVDQLLGEHRMRRS